MIYNPHVDKIIAKAARLEVGTWMFHNEGMVAQATDLYDEYTKVMYGVTIPNGKHYVAKAILAHNQNNHKESYNAICCYYNEMKEVTQSTYDAKRVSMAELNWWKIHDELGQGKEPEDLTKAFATLYASIFEVPEEQLEECCKHKTLATIAHDRAEDPKTLSVDRDRFWLEAEDHLVKFYTGLFESLSK